jgi:uncharacterized protein YjbI with pentapeptide repeats
LRGANLGDSRLFGTDLSNANLVGANLDQAGVVGANLQSADLTACPDGTNSDVDDGAGFTCLNNL